jgi:hypothetical protein
LSATFTLPSGDPGAVGRAAGQFGTLSGDHKTELTAFNGQVKHALASWKGPFAEQYAVAAGDTARRFGATITALTAMQHALSTYSGALQSAQTAVGSLNRQVAGKSGADAQKQEAHSLSGQESTATTTLHRAAIACATALQTAQTTLAASCPDTMSCAQFVQAVKNAEAKVNEGGKEGLTAYAGLDYMLAGWALFAGAKGGVKGAQAGAELAESEELVKALETKYTPAALKLIQSQIKDPDEQAGLLKLWEQVTLDAAKDAKAAKAATAIEGGSFLEGMLKAQNVEILKAGAHAANADEAASLFFRTSRLDVALAPITIYFGIHDLIWPDGETAWERDGNRAAGGAAAFGGALALATWAGALFGVTWEIPGVDIGTGAIAGVLLIAAAAWAAGDAIYTYRHDLWNWTKDAGKGIATAGEWTGKEVWDGTKWAGNELADAGKTIYHAPSHIVHGLEHLANPLNW